MPQRGKKARVFEGIYISTPGQLGEGVLITVGTNTEIQILVDQSFIYLLVFQVSPSVN